MAHAPTVSSANVLSKPTISHATTMVNASTNAAGRVRTPRINKQGATTSHQHTVGDKPGQSLRRQHPANAIHTIYQLMDSMEKH